MNQGAVSIKADKDYETGEDLDITSSKEDLANASTEDVENPGETVLTSVTSGDSDYAAKVKLNREQVRSKIKKPCRQSLTMILWMSQKERCGQ